MRRDARCSTVRAAITRVIVILTTPCTSILTSSDYTSAQVLTLFSSKNSETALKDERWWSATLQLQALSFARRPRLSRVVVV